ncbi:putative iron-containing alcohol dehydrogenase [Microlunatus phosphovorus NM-1]|uniref:Putative iron-containing alcohol dehydrogenase n=1 Tax=Microlunatus phosphovorus (strain ATCC 700054 / DSM 10555 / JCM 9379 / NBRC 101784 / NCIMB 13414 / VKM Ac-1990 / NM-1) TaxID=1032480 RepID=F5XJA5_MICPN|nr:iron-containing alcohol dehydrogenase [Microlunatus phosphovorus]BAK33431.1 putative iron-containing alcohol dehydrogenase [Microlunatus phosphovorus NM-1]
MTRFELAIPGDVRFGGGRLSEVPDALAGWGARRVLLVTGRSPDRAAALVEGLQTRGLVVTRYAVSGEPSIQVVRDGVAAAAGCDAVVGFGGGSAIDVAKAVAVLAVRGADPLEHLEVIGAGRPITAAGLPCVAIPTTAGTGSEVTRNSVLSGDGVKASLRSPLMLPRLAVVDPDLLLGVPVATIAASGMDALAQLIEPFLSRKANPVTDALARDGIVRSARSLRRARRDGMVDPSVREDLAIASLFGGLCLANAGLGAVHGFAAALGARLGAPHGAVCAAVLAPAIKVNLRAARRVRDRSAVTWFADLAVLLTGNPTARPEAAAGWLTELTTALQIPGLRTYGLTDADTAEVVAAAQRASSMKGNPIELTDDEVAEILARAT